jgi:UDP-glucuronate decarboxylase
VGIGLRKGFERRRVLVTGGAGFLGSHLCERLIAEHWDVLCVDNFFTGSRENVAGLLFPIRSSSAPIGDIRG